ncbi:MAG: hypothetical protein R3F34_16055 [Planctomycetota bacterium]
MSPTRLVVLLVLALEVLMVPLGTRMTVCLDGAHGNGDAHGAAHACVADVGWCSSRCAHGHDDHDHVDGAGSARADARIPARGDEGPQVDLPPCTGCTLVAFNDDSFAPSDHGAPLVAPSALLASVVVVDAPRRGRTFDERTTRARAPCPGRRPGELPMRI